MDAAATAPDDRGRLSALRRLWPYARPYRGLIALTFAAALLATLTGPSGTVTTIDIRGVAVHTPVDVGRAVDTGLCHSIRLRDDLRLRAGFRF